MSETKETPIPTAGPQVAPVEAPALPVNMTTEELRRARLERYRAEYGDWGAPVVNFFDRAVNTAAGVISSINHYTLFVWTASLVLNARIWRLFSWEEKVEIAHGKAIVSEENPLLTKSVLDTLMLWGAMLTAMFVFECWTWSGTFGYALGDDQPFQVALVSFVFAWAVVNVDRQILLADTYARPEALPSPNGSEAPNGGVLRALGLKVLNPLRKWVGLEAIPVKSTTQDRNKLWQSHLNRLAGSSSVRQMMRNRIGILLVIAVVNAVPLELKILAPEIEALIHRMELAVQATIRTIAETRAQTSANARRAQENTRYAGELQSYNVDRERQRIEMVRRDDGELARRRGANSQLQAQLRSEVQNGGVNANGSRRPPGYGESSTRLGNHAERDSASLLEYQREIRQQQEQFTAATTAHRSGLLAAHSANLEEIRLDEERLINHILSPSFLTEHESEWKRPRGFLARFVALIQLEGESIYAKVIIWGSRAIIVTLGMLFLFFKMGARQEVLAYLSLAHQAKHGHPKAQAQLRGRGVTDFDAFAREPSVKAAYAVWSGIEAEAARALNNLESKKCELARAELDGSFSPRLTQIQSELRTIFLQEVLPSLLRQKEFADFLGSQGIEHAVAQRFRETFDANMTGENLWKVTSEELTELGWKDPTPDREMLEGKLAEYANLQMSILHRVSDWTFRLIDFGAKNAPSLEVITAGQQAYQALQGDLLEMAQLEALFTKRVTPIPRWGKNGDPRDELMGLMVGNGPVKWLKQNTMWEDPTPEMSTEELEPLEEELTSASGAHPIGLSASSAPSPLVQSGSN